MLLRPRDQVDISYPGSRFARNDTRTGTLVGLFALNRTSWPPFVSKATRVGVATNTISRWETGTYEPTLNDLEKLARFFGKSIVQFFPQVETQDIRSQKVDALLRAAESLQQDDLDELRRYAEFRRARSLQKGTKQRKRS